MIFNHEESHESINIQNQNEFQDMNRIENNPDNNFTPSLYNPSKIYSSSTNFPLQYEKQNFIKFIKFLPNNKELLLITNDNKIQLLNFMEKDYIYEQDQSKESLYKAENKNIHPQILFQTKESNFIYDYDILYESNEFLQGNNTNSELNSNDYIKYFYICSKDNPVHVLNSQGKFCTSYLTKNHVEEIINPISIKIDQYSLNLFCGFSKFFTIFDLATDKLIQKNELRDKNYVKETNKISCFDFHHRNKFYLLGSYSGKIYSMDYLSNKTIFSLEGKHKNGINMLKFFNKSEHSLNFLSGGRRDNEILLWDFRNMAVPLFSFFRENQTNQKLNFVLDDNDNFLYVSNNDGSVTVYDLKNFNTVSYFYTGEAADTCKEAVSCIDFNSNLNCLVTAHGSRYNFDFQNEEILDGFDINSDSEEGQSDKISKSYMRNKLDSGFKFWDFKNLSSMVDDIDN